MTTGRINQISDLPPERRTRRAAPRIKRDSSCAARARERPASLLHLPGTRRDAGHLTTGRARLVWLRNRSPQQVGLQCLPTQARHLLCVAAALSDSDWPLVCHVSQSIPSPRSTRTRLARVRPAKANDEGIQPLAPDCSRLSLPSPMSPVPTPRQRKRRCAKRRPFVAGSIENKNKQAFLLRPTTTRIDSVLAHITSPQSSTTARPTRMSRCSSLRSSRAQSFHYPKAHAQPVVTSELAFSTARPRATTGLTATHSTQPNEIAIELSTEQGKPRANTVTWF